MRLELICARVESKRLRVGGDLKVLFPQRSASINSAVANNPEYFLGMCDVLYGHYIPIILSEDSYTSVLVTAIRDAPGRPSSGCGLSEPIAVIPLGEHEKWHNYQPLMLCM